MHKSIESTIDLNTKEEDGMTGFHCVCKYGYSNIAEMLVKKSADLNIELNVIDLNCKDSDDGWTAFQLSCIKGISV